MDVDVFLFDFDGTLIKPSIDFDAMYRKVRRVVREFGVDDPSIEQLHILEIIERAETHLRDDHGSCQAFLEQAHAAILELELEAAKHAEVYPGVPGMLEELGARGFGVGIVTRNSRPAVMRILQRIPLHHDVLLTRDDVEYTKPDPRHLLQALEHFPKGRRRAAMCGDHPMDVTAGKRVGALTVGVIPLGASEERFADVAPDLVISRPAALLDYVD